MLELLNLQRFYKEKSAYYMSSVNTQYKEHV